MCDEQRSTEDVVLLRSASAFSASSKDSTILSEKTRTAQRRTKRNTDSELTGRVHCMSTTSFVFLDPFIWEIHEDGNSFFSDAKQVQPRTPLAESPCFVRGRFGGTSTKFHETSVEGNASETDVRAGTQSTSQRSSVSPSDQMDIERERAQVLVPCVLADIAAWPIVKVVRTPTVQKDWTHRTSRDTS